MIRLRTLGRLELELPDGGSDDRLLRAPKRLAILVYLASEAGTMVRRDSLLPLFWPERDQAGARHALRNVLYELRQHLGEDTIRSRGSEDVGVDPERLLCDAVEFERALAAGRAEEAVSLYRGDFLSGFHLRDAAPEFEHWLEQRRETLRRGFAAAIEELAEASLVAGAPGQAARWWRRLARHDRLSGRGALRLMEALEAAGEKAEALRHADRHARFLRDELGAAPDPRVEAAADRIRGGHAPPPPVVPDAPATPATPGQPTPGARVRGSAAGPRDPAGGPPGDAMRRRSSTTRRSVLAAVATILAGAALVVAGRSLLGGSEPPVGSEIRRIAVLPLTNLTGDRQQDYLAAAITDQLVTQFAQIRGLAVISHPATRRSGDHAVPVREVAEELGVHAVIRGSVARAGDRVRITARLIDGQTGAHLWARDYTRDFRDLLSLEKDVAREIAREVEVNLTPEEEAQLRAARPISPAAQEAFLRGVYLQRRHQEVGASDTALEGSVRALSRAVELEPDWAEAHAELARAYHWLASGPPTPRTAGYYRKAKAAAQEAIRLDETLAGGHAALAFVLHAYERDWAGAERAYRRALELAGNDSYYRWGWALFELSAGRYEEAAADLRRALEHAPLSPALHAQLARALACGGRYEEVRAIAGLYDDDDPGALFYLGNLSLRQGAERRAVTLLERAVELSDSGPGALTSLAHAYASVGREAEARALIPALEARDAWIPAVYAALGEPERALDELERGYDQRLSALLTIRCRVAAAFTDLTTLEVLAGPRFQDLLRRIDFPG